MNRSVLTFALVVGLLGAASAASAQSEYRDGSVVAFGGFNIGGSSAQSLFGGNVAVNITRNIQAVGEFGRMGDVLPFWVSRVVALTPADLRVSALYGEGGVRLLGGRPSSHVRPYVEGTAGFARLTTRFSGAGSYDPFINAGLGFFDRTNPMLGFGGGVMLGAGPIALDFGYRYKKIVDTNGLDRVLTGGDSIGLNEVRIGVGVRF